MKVSVVIRKNETMELKICNHDFPNDYSFGSLEYIFLEGNYSCDCNLELFFYPGSTRDISCYADPGKELYTIMAIYADGNPVFIRTSILNDENIRETIIQKN